MLFFQALLGIIIIQAIFGRIAIRFRTDKVTDLAYGGAFLLVVWWVYLTGSDQSLLHTCLVRLISFRSVRLAGYLFLRVIVLGKDKRFDGIREVRRSFIRFRILQAVCIFLVLLPTLFAMDASQPSMARYGRIGVLVALGGFSLETIADRQKFRFKQQYPTRRCDTGVWSIIRYPNYL